MAGDVSRTEPCTCLFRELFGFLNAFPLVNRQKLLVSLLGQHSFFIWEILIQGGGGRGVGCVEERRPDDAAGEMEAELCFHQCDGDADGAHSEE